MSANTKQAAGIDATPVGQPAAHDEALTDEKIEVEAIKYALYVRPDGAARPGSYDVTQYECREDFFNCVRACAALAAAPVPAPPAGQIDAARDVLAERQRQMDVEGWTPEHDDAHQGGQLARAAATYAITGSSDGRTVVDDGSTPSVTARLWPWEWPWFKPTNRRRNLVKAGALILAEIERLDRATPSPQGAENNTKGVK